MEHRLEDFAFGRVTVDGEVHTKDLIVHDGGVIAYGELGKKRLLPRSL